ncbi:MAG TPA: peptidylglycine alpha-amidating monooxygenase [Polyangiaceae bacterium]|nr:peptidylglycine alpha-amidating monooxygenase [Polyangiaceae bacterium]
MFNAASPRSSARGLVLVALGALLGLAAACDSGGSDTTGSTSASTGSGPAGEGLPCEVADILSGHCQSCHSSPPKFGAPMPLLTRADLLAAPVGDGKDTAAHVGDLVVTRTAAGEMPPPPDVPLSEADQATLASYVQAGMPESSDTCGGGGGGAGGGGPTLDCTPDTTLQPATAFEMPADQTDLYVCFGLEMSNDVQKQITAIAPLIDNTTIIHHILLLQAPEAVSAQGEQCDFVNTGWKLVYAWGPGTGPLVLPKEAGYPVGPNDPGHFVLQIHYNNLMGLSGEKDRSGVQFCTTTDLRPNDADIMAFGGMNFDDIGPAEEKTLKCTTKIPDLLSSYLPVDVFRAWPHMHKLGVALDTQITKADATTSTLVDSPNYDFEYQVGYPTDTKLEVGDSVTTRCTWKNTTNGPVGFGEGTGDEMCFDFVSYYPRIDNAQWNWLLPAYAAQCAWE